MKTSVVMATYNGVDYLLEQLDSLRDQSMQIEEVIICDDRSTDDTAVILSFFEKRHRQIKVIINETIY